MKENDVGSLPRVLVTGMVCNLKVTHFSSGPGDDGVCQLFLGYLVEML
jgi:hypothetical protein